MTEEIRVCDDKSSFQGDAQCERLSILIEDARTIGCEAALRKHDHNVEYLMDEGRARYIDIVGIRPDEDVLEIGASMGQHTRLIARRCRRLEALEVDAGQAEFASLWCQESGLGNVRFTVGGGTGALPYGDGAFDVVVMNYVLEWSAGRDSQRPEEFHLRLLREVARALKPGGRFFVSTKNRYGLRLLLGAVDEHLGIRFGNALPRWLARVLSNRQARDMPIGYLHSRRGLQNLLCKAGFAKVDAFLSFPDARRPDVILPFNKAGLARLRELDKKRYSRKDRLYLALPKLLKERVATSHTFIACKSA